jgi:ElaB/YqjD/DUF883 family membrane-anchored ribosome-binding protein
MLGLKSIAKTIKTVAILVTKLFFILLQRGKNMEQTATHNGTGKKVKSEIDSTVEALKDKSQSLKEDLADIKSLLADLFVEGAEYVKEGGSDKLHSLEKKGMKKIRSLERSIENHPVESILIGAGVGLLFGVYLFRK